MDWTKSKNIMIIALLVTNLIIGLTYYSTIREKRKEWAVQARNTAVYLMEQGIELDVEIPDEPRKMSVLFVRFEPSDPEVAEAPVYDGEILVESTRTSLKVVPISRGENRREIMSASHALLRYLAVAEQQDRKPAGIKGIELIYLVDTAGYDREISEDTAIPAWKLSLGDGETFYVNAYGE